MGAGSWNFVLSNISCVLFVSKDTKNVNATGSSDKRNTSEVFMTLWNVEIYHYYIHTIFNHSVEMLNFVMSQRRHGQDHRIKQHQ